MSVTSFWPSAMPLGLATPSPWASSARPEEMFFSHLCMTISSRLTPPSMPGNSGGALINTRGELIGINTRNLDSVQGAQNIGFAIPIGLARNVMKQIIDYGSVRRGWLGAEFSNLRPTALPDGSRIGAASLCTEVTEDGPAWKAGIRQGDIILALERRTGGRYKPTSILAISQREPGSQVELKVSRGDESFETYATLLQQPPLAIAIDPLLRPWEASPRFVPGICRPGRRRTVHTLHRTRRTGTAPHLHWRRFSPATAWCWKIPA